MQVVQTLRQVTTKLLNRVLRELLVLLDKLVKVTTCAVFKNDPQVIPGFIPVEES